MEVMIVLGLLFNSARGFPGVSPHFLARVFFSYAIFLFESGGAVDG